MFLYSKSVGEGLCALPREAERLPYIRFPVILNECEESFQPLHTSFPLAPSDEGAGSRKAD